VTSEWDFVLVGIAALAAGVVNAIAGGGTLITFPMLTAVGVPVVAANVTSTVALCPGYLGATWAQFKDLRGQARRLWLMLPAAVVGGIAGGALLLNTEERVFQSLVPFFSPCRTRCAPGSRAAADRSSPPCWGCGRCCRSASRRSTAAISAPG
jgi:uncharacterized membrane protein YfcA